LCKAERSHLSVGRELGSLGFSLSEIQSVLSTIGDSARSEEGFCNCGTELTRLRTAPLNRGNMERQN